MTDKITVLLYSHRHGIDIELFKTMEEAHAYALSIVKEYRQDLGVPESLSDQEALDDWPELTGCGEFIEIETKELRK
jgi:hypothetical protein